MVSGGWLRLAVVSCGVSWEREKDDAEGWGRVFGSGRRMLTRRWGGGYSRIARRQPPSLDWPGLAQLARAYIPGLLVVSPLA